LNRVNPLAAVDTINAMAGRKPRKSPKSRSAAGELPLPGPSDRAPAWIAPMLATLIDQRDFAVLASRAPDRWIVERKLDGFRALAFRHGESLRLLSRNRKDLGLKFPEIAHALRDQPLEDFIVDGEVVALDPGAPKAGRRGTGEDAAISFELLQQRLAAVSLEEARRKGIRLAFFAFDLLRAAGHDVRSLPLVDRKRLLKQALVFNQDVRFLPHHRLSSRINIETAAQRGWEGLLAKLAHSPYVSQRSQAWLKLKCTARQEFVIGGWTDPAGSRSNFGALLLGYYDQGRLLYAGRVGTGFSTALLASIGRRLAAMEVAARPFEPDDELPRSGVHWTRPELVAEVAFGEWTSDNKLRHPRFLGLRSDKPAAEVVRETPDHS
jgi:bifunctional non-homologous end joining protein LigD